MWYNGLWIMSAECHMMNSKTKYMFQASDNFFFNLVRKIKLCSYVSHKNKKKYFFNGCLSFDWLKPFGVLGKTKKF